MDRGVKVQGLFVVTDNCVNLKIIFSRCKSPLTPPPPPHDSLSMKFQLIMTVDKFASMCLGINIPLKGTVTISSNFIFLVLLFTML